MAIVFEAQLTWDLDLFVSDIFQLRDVVILDRLPGGLQNRAENRKTRK